MQVDIRCEVLAGMQILVQAPSGVLPVHFRVVCSQTMPTA